MINSIKGILTCMSILLLVFTARCLYNERKAISDTCHAHCKLVDQVLCYSDDYEYKQKIILVCRKPELHVKLLGEWTK